MHDHLDGGLRPATLIDIAAQIGHALPTDDPAALAGWFYSSANSGSLERYLATFDHTVAVMQRSQDLHRVARECVPNVAGLTLLIEMVWPPQADQGLRRLLLSLRRGLSCRPGLFFRLREPRLLGGQQLVDPRGYGLALLSSRAGLRRQLWAACTR